MKTAFQKILFLLLLLVAHKAAAQVRFTADGPASVAAGERFRVQYKVNTDRVSGFSGPSFSHLDVLSGPMTSTYSSAQIVNGHASSSSSVTYTYLLSAPSRGKVVIPPATVEVGGRTYRSPSLTITVTAGGAAGSSARTASQPDEAQGMQRAGSRVTDRDLYLTVTANKRRVYEQEPVVLTYKFHARVGVGLSNIMLKKKPALDGFLVQEVPLPANLAPTVATHGGATYKEGTNMQYVVFPQKTGSIEIPPLTFDCEVVQQDMSIDPIDAFFNGGGHISLRVPRSTPSLTLEVLPLPTPKPAGFSGAVGRFTIKGELLSQAATNEMGTYRITLQGAGNMKMIKAPAVTFPKDFETYSPKTSDDTELTADGLTGKITYDYTFAPRNQGKYTIPAVEFVYFDSEQQAYRTIRTQPQEVTVAKGKRSAADLERELQLRDSDIRPPKSGAQVSSSPSLLAWGVPGVAGIYALMLLGAAAAYAGLRRYQRRHGDVALQKYRKAGRKALRRMQELARQADALSSADYFAAVAQTVSGYVADKYAVGQENAGKAELVALMREKGAGEALAAQAESILDECEFARFAPSASVDKRGLYERALHLIEALEKQR